ncbi:MFS transporter [Nannocystis sp. ILAH1]|uniref:MFS transporter n=1 Tax=Nannocystis sp. ILAH1 TaxID=2996789 RepID=UPI00226E9A2D|nr:MFS transporter [Nannocystis sp. ILAH1]MCY0992202.1 MFS transporter [Nannocystis sp. ILAH1]
MPEPTASSRHLTTLLVLAYLGFVSLGLPDAVLGVAWPSLRAAFSLPQAALGAPLAALAVSYFLSGLAAGSLMRRAGIGALLAGSTAIVTLAVAGFASAPSFGVFLAAACIGGFGSGAIDAALNAYVAHNFGARHMTWLHAAYSLGAALGPALMTAVLAREAGWRTGYAVLAGALGVLAVAFILTRRRWDEGAAATAPDAATSTASAEQDAGPHVLRRPRVWLQLGFFFLYTGLEMSAGQWAFTVLTEARGLDESQAGTQVSLYWASLLAGRIVLGFVVERVGPVLLVRLATALAVLSAAVFALPGLPPVAAFTGLALLGFALAPMYPVLMAETPRRMGSHAAHAVGFQVSAATAGIAAMPSLAGLLGQRLGLGAIPWFLVGTAVALALLHETLVATVDRPGHPRSSPR